MKVLLALLFISANIWAHELQVLGTRRGYSLTVTEKLIQFKTEKASLDLIKKNCNASLIIDFLDSFEETVVNGTKVVNSDKNAPMVYKLNKEDFQAIAGSPTERALLTLPEEIIKLKLIEDKRCNPKKPATKKP